ncbi:hypothetical protein LEMLEM_LOCUS3695 [Lemmus lemmus]
MEPPMEQSGGEQEPGAVSGPETSTPLSSQAPGSALGRRAAPSRPDLGPAAPAAPAAARQPRLPGSRAAAPGGAAPLRRRSGGSPDSTGRVSPATAGCRGAAGAGAGSVSRMAVRRGPGASTGTESAAPERGPGRLRPAEPPSAGGAG